MFKQPAFYLQAGFGFNEPPPSSRPPTEVYDRLNHVLVMHESEAFLKFMKMHLNRYFSNVHVAQKLQDSLDILKNKPIDLVIADATPMKKQNLEIFQKLASKWRHIPAILVTEPLDEAIKRLDYPNIVVIDVIKIVLNFDIFHCAIRRALRIRGYLKEISEILPARAHIGEVIHTDKSVINHQSLGEMVQEIRACLTNEVQSGD